MAEWLKAAVLKTASREPGRGFESYSLRQPTLKFRLASHPSHQGYDWQSIASGI